MKCTIQLKFKFEEYNGFMNLDIIYDRYIIEVDPLNPEIIFDIDMPCDIKFLISGKNQQVDTLVDKNNNIVIDKHIKLIYLKIDHYEIPIDIMEHIIIFKSNNNTIYGTYFGFNGTALLNLTETDAFKQLIVYNNRIT